MKKIKDLRWHKGMTVEELVDNIGDLGFQSINLKQASDNIMNMLQIDAKIFLTFTSNMVTSGLRGFFAQLIEYEIPDVIVTTAGGLEEDIMKALGESFIKGSFNTDDIELHEKGMNRVGNIYIPNTSYEKLESEFMQILSGLYDKKSRWSVYEILKEVGLQLDDENSILYQAAKKNVPIFCPAITDGSLGYHFRIFQQDHKDFVIDTIKDFKKINDITSYDDKKGLIALGGGISKHYAILSTLLSGGMDYAIYMTTSSSSSGSMSGATTREAKSWGKINDDSYTAQVKGDVTITFPLVMINVLEKLSDAGHIEV